MLSGLRVSSRPPPRCPLGLAEMLSFSSFLSPLTPREGFFPPTVLLGVYCFIQGPFLTVTLKVAGCLWFHVNGAPQVVASILGPGVEAGCAVRRRSVILRK